MPTHSHEKLLKMTPTIEALLKVVATAVGPFSKWIGSLRAQKVAGTAPEKFEAPDQSAFDSVFRRLCDAAPSDSLFSRSYNAAVNAYITPEFLKTKSVQVWLLEPGVKNDLQLVASSKNLGTTTPLDAVQRLESMYREVASANAQEAGAVVAAMGTILAAAIQGRVADKGTAALVAASSKEVLQNIEGVSAKLDSLLSGETPGPQTSTKLFPLSDTEAVLWREAFSVASTGLLMWPTDLTDGNHIVRPEMSQLVEFMESRERGTIALLGQPGSGKSALLAALGKHLQAKSNIALLAIKGDLLDADVATEEDLKRSLALPELPTTMLRRFALSGPAVVLIDQLDALAGHLDTKTGRLSVLLNLVKAVSSADAVYVFVSCRTFEFTHDLRLSRIDAESLALALPSWEQVLPVLQANGVNANGWNSDAREVLCVPQQLNTYLLLKSTGIDEPFSNYTAMLDRLWSTRVLVPSGGGKAAELAYQIAEMMAEKETLWIAGSRFDHRPVDVTFLISAGILTTTKEGAVGFSHQTVFEHVLARNFAKNDGRLSAYVLSRATSLFVRPKLWAALAYQRGVEPATYELELAAIWNAPGLRKHLRFLLLEFMGSQAKPTDKEEVLLVEASQHEELLPVVLKAIVGSQGWFERLSRSVIATAMGNQKTGDMCIQNLVSAWEHSAPAVTKLLREIWLPNVDNDRRMLFVLQEASDWTPELIEVGKLIAGRFDVSEMYVDHLVATIGGTRPDVAIDLLLPFMVRLWSGLKAEALRKKVEARAEKPGAGDGGVAWHMTHNPLRPMSEFFDDRHQWDSIPELASASPSHFVAALWPWYLEAFRDMLGVTEADTPYFGYPLQYAADFRFEGEDRNGLHPSSILDAIAVALEKLADSAPLEVLSWAQAQDAVELAPVQRLVAHALSFNPSQTAKAAFEFLLKDERRYFLGGISDSSSTTLKLIATCAPYWSTTEVSDFTTKVKAYTAQRPIEREAPEDIRAWSRVARRTRVNLVRALPEATRSSEIRRDIEEANRAIPQRVDSVDFNGGWIGPTMNSTQFAKASTDAIVNAFKLIPDKTGWDHPKHFRRGGNIQLSRAFADFAKEHPDRAVEVIQHLQPQFAQRAAGYAVENMADVCDSDVLMSLVVELHGRGFTDDEFKSSVARAIERLVARDVVVGEPAIELLESWLFGRENEFSDTDTRAEREQEDSADSTTSDRFLLSGHPQMEVLPSGDYPIIAAAIAARYVRKDAAGVIALLRRYLFVSPNVHIWKRLARSTAQLPFMDEKNGPILIGEVLSLHGLDGSAGAAYLMGTAHTKALAQVMPNLRRWRDSKALTTRKGYGELVALIAVSNPEGVEARRWLAEIVEVPELSDARVGAAATAVQILWLVPEFRTAATTLLLALLARNESAVWHQVFRLFGLVDKLEPEPDTVRLLSSIANSIHFAPAPNEPYVVDRLGGLLPVYAQIVSRIASQLIQLWRDKLANMGSSLVVAGQEMMDLAVTLHRTEGTQLAGLQMFEQLVEIDAYQAREMLDEIDHRMRLGHRSARPRLRRRAGRRPRRPADTESTKLSQAS
jgi:hypothetical protein